MDITEVLHIADCLVFAKTGKHLDDIQERVIKGVWEGKTYDRIADDYHCSESHIRNIGYKLWRVFSDHLDQNINKHNFRSTLSRLNLTSSPIVIQNKNNTFNYCISSPQYHLNNLEKDQQLFKHDLKFSPQIISFYGREKEMKTLLNWQENIHLISVLGLSGIGKTTLVKRFVDLNLHKFPVIIWRSLKFPKSLDLLINDLLNVCEQEAKETIDEKLKQLFDILINKKCLIILDDIENIFINGQFAGQYKNEYKNYQKFFTMITEVEHQSNIILISQEKCAEMECLNEDLYPIKCLNLSGLEDAQILKDAGLNDENSWLKLINLYEGNPLYLKSISLAIKNIFDGDVADFLVDNSLIITQNMQSLFSELFNKVSSIEQEIIRELSKFNQPVSKEKLKQNLQLSSMDFVNGLQSLQQRYLITKIKEDKILFYLSPVFQEYMRSCHQK